MGFLSNADLRLFGRHVRRLPYVQIGLLAYLFFLNLLLISRNASELIEFPFVMVLIVPYFFLTLKYPEMGLAIFIIFHLTPLKALTSTETSSLSLSILVELCLVAVLLLHFLVSRRLVRFQDNLSFVFFVYIGFYIVAAIWRSTPTAGREGGWIKSMIVFLLTYIFIVGFIDSREKLIRFLRSLVLLSLFWFVASFMDILKYGFESIYMRERTSLGFFPKWTQVDILAMTVLMFLPLLYFLLFQKQPRTWHSMTLWAMVLSPITVFFTASRNGFVSLIVVLALLLLRKKRASIKWAFVMIMVVLIIFAPSGYRQRISTIADMNVESGLSLKISHVQRGLGIISQNPLFGIGLGKLQRAIHNTFLQIAVDVGLPAMFLFLVLMFMAFVRLRKAGTLIIANPSVAAFSELPLMLMISLVAYLIGGLTVSSNLMLPFFIILGLVTVIKNVFLDAPAASENG